MKNLLFGLFAYALFINTAYAQNLQEKLKALEDNTATLKKNDKINLENVKSDNNSYDYCGLELYNAIVEVQSITKAQKQKSSDYEKEVIPLVNTVQNKLPFRNLEFNKDEKLLFDSFIKNIKMETALEKAKAYEDFVKGNFTQNTVKNFLIALSEFKYASYAKRRSLSSFEGCVDRCMDNTFSNYNAIDWFVFIAGNPGRGVLQVFASCSWKCW